MAALLQSLVAASSLALASAVRRTAVSVAGLLVSVVLLFTSIAFLTLATYRALVEAIGPIQAPLVIGTAYLVFALIGTLVVQSRR
jgi:hypothetical protein